MIHRYEIRAQSAPWHNGVEMMAFDVDGNVGKPVEFVKREGYHKHEATFKISMDHAQSLMDDLWNAGLRPTSGAGSAGSLRATENHLKDMRDIVFSKLKIEQLPCRSPGGLNYD